jgi:hypothetical protein
VRMIRDSLDHWWRPSSSPGILVKSAIYSPIQPRMTTMVDAYPSHSQSAREDQIERNIAIIKDHRRRFQYTLGICFIAVLAMLSMQVTAYLRDLMAKRKGVGFKDGRFNKAD